MKYGEIYWVQLPDRQPRTVGGAARVSANSL